MLEHPGFFERKGPFSVAEVCAATGAKPSRADAALRLYDIKPLQSATERELSFLDNRKYVDQATTSKAAACLIRPDVAERLPANALPLITDQPYRAFAKALFLFYPQAGWPLVNGPPSTPIAGPIHPTARIEDGVVIEPGAVIGAEAEIGRGSRISANAVIGYRVTIGRDCFVGPGAKLIHCLIGDRAIIHSGVAIGQDGFGFAMGAQGHLKVPQIGRVIIQDDVEIGANTTIDRGALNDTVVGEGTKIDNLVQLGHNVVVGRHCVIVSHAAIAGSTVLGDFVVVAGCAAIAGHLKIGTGAQIAGMSAVLDDVPPGKKIAGLPAQGLRQWAREQATLRRLAERNRSD